MKKSVYSLLTVVLICSLGAGAFWAASTDQDKQASTSKKVQWGASSGSKGSSGGKTSLSGKVAKQAPQRIVVRQEGRVRIGLGSAEEGGDGRLEDRPQGQDQRLQRIVVRQGPVRLVGGQTGGQGDGPDALHQEGPGG